MAYDRYEPRREGRDARPRWRDEDRERGWNERGERGWFERAGDEIASWFGDEDSERRRRREPPERGQFERFGGHLRNEDDVQRYYGERDRDRDRGGRERAFMGDEDFGRSERAPRWRDEGQRRPYTGRPASRQEPGRQDSGRQDSGRQDSGRQDSGQDRSREPYRPLTGDYGRGFDERMERGAAFYGVGDHHDRHYGEWRARQVEELDRDYEDYARENRTRFEDDFSSWRDRRKEKRGLLGQVREHMEVVGSDGEHVGTVDRRAGDRLILTKSDPDAGGAHHSLMCTAIDRIDGDKVILEPTAEDAKKHWRDESRDRALFEREDQGEAGPHVLGRSFSGTY